MVPRNSGSRTYGVYRIAKVFEKYHYIPHRAAVAFKRIRIQFDQDDGLKTSESLDAASQCAKLGAFYVHFDEIEPVDLVLFTEKIQGCDMNASRNPVNRVNRLAEISRTGVRWLIHYEGAARSIGKALFPRMHAASEVEFQISCGSAA